MSSTKLSRSLAENILVLSCYSDEHASLLFSCVTIDHFDSILHKDVYRQAYNFFQSFKETPKDHTPDLLDDIINGKDKKRARLYTAILLSIKETWEEGVNSKYIISELKGFVRKQNLRLSIMEAADAVQSDDIDKAEELLHSHLNAAVKTFEPGLMLFEEESEKLFNPEAAVEAYPTGIKALDDMNIGPAPGELMVLLAPPNKGKCFGKNTMIRMFDGTVKPVQSITEGEKVIGPDGSARNVFGVNQGVSKMYRISNNQNDKSYIVNKNHILSLKARHKMIIQTDPDASKFHICKSTIVLQKGESFDITVEEYLKLSESQKFNLVWWEEASLHDNEEDLPIPPYVLGIWLGDGHLSGQCVTNPDKPVIQAWEDFGKSLGSKGKKNNFLEIRRSLGIEFEKGIPDVYLNSSYENRLQLLAGIIDTDGYLKQTGFEITQKEGKFANDIIKLVDSLGIARRSIGWKKMDLPEVGIRKYLKLHTRGDVSFIPTRVKRKQASYPKKPRFGVLRIEELPEDSYFGFAVDADHRFLLEDGTVVHNTWFMVNVGKTCAIHRLKVLHISLEMNEEKIGHRYMQSIYALTKREQSKTVQPVLEKENNSIEGIDFEEIRRPALLSDENKDARDNHKKKRKRLQVVVKQFPTGQLDVPGLRAYLQSLEMLNSFIPDVVILDYADLMRVRADHLRTDVGELYKDIRGIAIERNIAVVTASQANRTGASAKTVGLQHLSEDFSKAMTADNVISYSQTQQELQHKLARLFLAKVRDEGGVGSTILLAQNYDTGQFALDSAFVKTDYESILNGMSSDEDDDDEED